MAIDWDRVVVESDDNGVVVSAGQVALLIGAEADTVQWGNITGDITQQPDVMVMTDGKADVESPTFTGTPRSVTPPAGNNSTRIATTAYVQGEISDFIEDAPTLGGKLDGRQMQDWTELGELATKNDVSSDGFNYARKNRSWSRLGSLATANDASPNGSMTKKTWIRTNEVDGQGGTHPQWERLDDFDDSTSGLTKVFGRHYVIDEETGKKVPKWMQLGEMAKENDVPTPSNTNVSNIYGRKVTKTTSDSETTVTKDWQMLSSLAMQDTVNYQTQVTNKPLLGSLASKDQVDYVSDITNKPTLGSMASKNDAPSDGKNYARSNLDWKALGDFAAVNEPPNQYDDNARFARRYRWLSGNRIWKPEWELLGTMARMDDAPSDELIYGRKNGIWEMINLEGMTEIYVSPNGSLAGAGTRDDPISSLWIACDKASSTRPVTIHAEAGSYDGYAINVSKKTIKIVCDEGTASIGEVTVTTSYTLELRNGGQLMLEGNFNIISGGNGAVRARDGAFFSHSGGTLTVQTNGNAFVIQNGSHMSCGFTHDGYSNYTAVFVSGGSIASVGTIKGTNTQSIKKVFEASGGIIMYSSVHSSLTYTTLSSADYGGRIFTN